MSFKFNNQVFEVVENRDKKTIMKERDKIDDLVVDYWTKTREKTSSYNLLSILNTSYGRLLVAKAEEAMRIEHYFIVHNLDSNIAPARENIYKCFKEIDDFLNKTFDIKVKQQ